VHAGNEFRVWIAVVEVDRPDPLSSRVNGVEVQERQEDIYSQRSDPIRCKPLQRARQV
jgi:hypothetical protein